MHYTKEEREEIGRQIYTHKISIREASEKYHRNWYTVRDYMRQYRDMHRLPPMSSGRDTYRVINKAKEEGKS